MTQNSSFQQERWDTGERSEVDRAQCVRGRTNSNGPLLLEQEGVQSGNELRRAVGMSAFILSDESDPHLVVLRVQSCGRDDGNEKLISARIPLGTWCHGKLVVTRSKKSGPNLAEVDVELHQR